jgi:hypothetical protein
MKNRKFVFLWSLLSGIFILDVPKAGVAEWEPASQTTEAAEAHSAIMLILGSSDPETRATRVALACDMIRIQGKNIRFDKIIFSGGCGAHGTDAKNCEASDMQRQMEDACRSDISGIRLFREEHSGSTAQNYCYSRDLREGGEALIRKEDRLYVVSSHYHALSVAACFRKDGVDARYYYTCGGGLFDGIPPSLETVVSSNAACYRDYAGIAQNCDLMDWCGQQKHQP